LVESYHLSDESWGGRVKVTKGGELWPVYLYPVPEKWTAEDTKKALHDFYSKNPKALKLMGGAGEVSACVCVT
jgi:hypothetical protein